MAEARHLSRLLHVHSEVDHVEQDLGVALGLHVAPHDPVAEPRPAVPEGHPGHVRVEGALAGLEFVRVALLEREPGAPVLEGDPGARHHQPGAEAAEDAVDERDGVAVLVHHRQVDRVAVVGHAGGHFPRRPLRFDGGAPGGRVLLRDERLDRDPHVLGVPEGCVPVGEGQLLGLDEAVEVRRRVVAKNREIAVSLEDVQHFEGHEPLGVRGDLEDLDAPVGGADGVHPGRVVRRQVVPGHEAALRFHEVVEGFGDLAAVEDVGPHRGDLAEGLREVR